MGMAMETRMTMIVTTTISSTNVKPRDARALPVLVGRAIGRFLLRLSEYIEKVLSSPGVGAGIVLRAAHAPFVFTGERIFGDGAKELHFGAIGVVGEQLAFHQNVQRFRVAIGTQLG